MGQQETVSLHNAAASPAALAVIRRTTEGVEIVISRATVLSRIGLFGTHFALTFVSVIALWWGLFAVWAIDSLPRNAWAMPWAVMWCIVAGGVGIVSLCLGLGFFLARPGRLVVGPMKQRFVPYYADAWWSYRVSRIRVTRVSPTEVGLELAMPQLTHERYRRNRPRGKWMYWLKCSVASERPEVMDLVEGEVRERNGECRI